MSLAAACRYMIENWLQPTQPPSITLPAHMLPAPSRYSPFHSWSLARWRIVGLIVLVRAWQRDSWSAPPSDTASTMGPLCDRRVQSLIPLALMASRAPPAQYAITVPHERSPQTCRREGRGEREWRCLLSAAGSSICSHTAPKEPTTMVSASEESKRAEIRRQGLRCEPPGVRGRGKTCELLTRRWRKVSLGHPRRTLISN